MKILLVIAMLASSSMAFSQNSTRFFKGQSSYLNEDFNKNSELMWTNKGLRTYNNSNLRPDRVTHISASQTLRGIAALNNEISVTIEILCDQKVLKLKTIQANGSIVGDFAIDISADLAAGDCSSLSIVISYPETSITLGQLTVIQMDPF